MIDRERLVRWYDWQAPFYRLWRNRYDDPLLASLDRRLPRAAGTVVLDAACGAGFASLGLGGGEGPRRFVGIDLSIGMLRVARREQARLGRSGTSFAVGDVLAVPLADASVDAVLVVGLIPFLERPVTALSELRRVVRPGGVLVSAEFDRAELTGATGAMFRTMMAGHALLARVLPRIRYADEWDVDRSTIDPATYEAALAEAGWRVDARERAHRHLIYVAVSSSASARR